MATEATSGQGYVLGHDQNELERLRRQSDFYRDITATAIDVVGITPGMRVLDAGCGLGDVTMLLADKVGAGGAVFAVDKAPEAVAKTTQRAASNAAIQVVQGDIDTIALDAPVDAVFGRLVLMHVGDQVRSLRNLAGQISPGGIIAFQEFDLGLTESVPDVPLATHCHTIIEETFSRAGIDPRTGLRLHRQFMQAGLPGPEVWSLGRIEQAPAQASCEMLAGVVRTLLPMIEAMGTATSAEIEVDTLADRLMASATEVDAVVITPPLVTAWSRLPA